MRKKSAVTRRVIGELLNTDEPRKSTGRKPNMRYIMELQKKDASSTRNRPTIRCDTCRQTYCAEYVRIVDYWNGSIQICDFCRRSH